MCDLICDVITCYVFNPFPVYPENTRRLKIVSQRLPRDNSHFRIRCIPALFTPRYLAVRYLFITDAVSS